LGDVIFRAPSHPCPPTPLPPFLTTVKTERGGAHFHTHHCKSLKMDIQKVSLFSALYNGGFGVQLLASPNGAFGPNSMMPYFSEEGNDLAQFFGRAFGSGLLAIGLPSLLAENDAEREFSLIGSAIGAMVIWPIMIMNAASTTGMFKKAMWTGQAAFHIVPMTIFIVKSKILDRIFKKKSA